MDALTVPRTLVEEPKVVRAPAVDPTMGRPSKSDTLRKAVDALAIVPTRQRIFPLARKLYNVMLYLAQRQGLENDTYRATLTEITNKANFHSRDLELVKNHLRQMNSTQVEWQSPTSDEGARWDVSNLIAHASIEEPGQGKAITVEWSFAPNIKRELLDPTRFAQISLAFQSSLRSHASIALFEICSRYVDNPSHLTARNDWEWWRPVLTGIPESEASAYLKYKYFKRDVLTPTVAELNKVTDLQIEMIEHKEGRRIRELQFSVRRKEQSALPFEERPELDLALIGQAVRLGVSQLAAEQLQQKHGDALLKEALGVVTERMQASRGSPIANVERYLIGVARQLADNPPEPTSTSDRVGRSQDKEAPNRKALEARFREDRRREARALFGDLDSEEQSAWIERFESEFLAGAAPVIRRSYKKGGLDTPVIRAEFGRWLAEQTWGETWDQPSAEELLQLVVGPAG